MSSSFASFTPAPSTFVPTVAIAMRLCARSGCGQGQNDHQHHQPQTAPKSQDRILALLHVKMIRIVMLGLVATDSESAWTSVAFIVINFSGAGCGFCREHIASGIVRVQYKHSGRCSVAYYL